MLILIELARLRISYCLSFHLLTVIFSGAGKISSFYIRELLHLRKLLVTFELMKIKNMKKISVLIFSVLVALCFSANVMAQAKPQTQITTVHQQDETVRFSLSSTKPFIFGDNRYVLYIGHNEFFAHEQSKQDGKGYMTFLIPADEYSRLKEGAAIYLTYGKVNVDEQDMTNLAKTSRCWPLGKFSKSLLK